MKRRANHYDESHDPHVAMFVAVVAELPPSPGADEDFDCFPNDARPMAVTIQVRRFIGAGGISVAAEADVPRMYVEDGATRQTYAGLALALIRHRLSTATRIAT